MRIFAAASTSKGGGGYDRVLEAERYPNVLIAFPYDPDGVYLGGGVERGGINYYPDFVLTDSGAFSVWKSGDSIDLQGYIDYCTAYRDADAMPSPMVHVNLDVMPGEFGRMPTDKERERGMAKSIENADAMRAAGLPVMEVYHQFEPLDFLDELLARRQPGEIVGISPRQGLGHSIRKRFCDGVFSHLLGSDSSTSNEGAKSEVPPCHGLGVASKELIHRYPWWSVDAVSWIAPGVYGRVMARSGYTEHQPGRTRSRDVRHHECAEYLRTWKRWTETLDRLWAQRGVTWQTPPTSP